MPEKWNNTKKIAVTVKQQVAPLQANEVASLRRKAAAFDTQQFSYREQFRKLPPFFYDCENPYEDIDNVSGSGAKSFEVKAVAC